MLFNSLTFVLFFLGVLLGNAALPLRFRNAWILMASLVFYASCSPSFILLLLVTAAVDYRIALKMAALPTRAARKPWLWVSLLFGIGSLLFFKYSQMALDTAGTLGRWLGTSWTPPHPEILLPLGISFYTFETLSYAIDVYRGELAPRRSFFEYLSFLLFFPKLIAGPIVRASEFLPQWSHPRSCNAEHAQYAIHLLAIAFGKKILLADQFAPFIERVFASPLHYNRWVCLAAVFGYSMQVYLDFSAYSDIAQGCARLLGYDLPHNFRQPYLAISISDFWRRWHLSLSRWLRDYVYIPLGGNQLPRWKTYRNLAATMLLGGLWHGANWTFVAWGALNGLFLIAERAWCDWRGVHPRRPEDLAAWQKPLRIACVFSLITLTRVFFRSPTFSGAIDLLHSIALPTVHEAQSEVALLGIPLAFALYLWLARYRERWLSMPLGGWTIPGYACYLSALLMLGARQAEFIYFQF